MNSDAKTLAAEKAVGLIEDGMVVGLGSGSTSSRAIQKLGERVKAGLKIRAIASSVKSATLAKTLSIPLLEADETNVVVDIAIDGADEVDIKGNLLKGGGGSLLREKIVAFASKRFYVMVDETKLVQKLGKFPLPVEIAPFVVAQTLRHLHSAGCVPVLRRTKDSIFITDNGNYIADCAFGEIDDPAWLDVKLKMIPGVLETGLFSARIVTAVFVGYRNGDVREMQIAS